MIDNISKSNTHYNLQKAAWWNYSSKMILQFWDHFVCANDNDDNDDDFDLGIIVLKLTWYTRQTKSNQRKRNHQYYIKCRLFLEVIRKPTIRRRWLEDGHICLVCFESIITLECSAKQFVSEQVFCKNIYDL